MPLDPALAALAEQVNALPPLVVAGADPVALRELIRGAGAATPVETSIEVGAVQDTAVPGPAGDVPVRVYRPAADHPAPTVVFFHGGGWLVGDLDTHDDIARRICRDAAAVVVAVHYRRTPEHPFPAPLDDCLAVARWVADHIADYGGRPDRLAVAGDSAGANMTAVTALTFRDEHRPLAAQLLAYPPTDLGGEYPSRSENAEGYLLTRQMYLDLQQAYVGDDPAAKASWRVSPLLADNHTGLALAIVATAQYDPLRDEGIAYAQTLKAAGVDVFHRNYDGLTHAFLNFFGISPGAEAATAELIAQLRERLA